MFTDIEGSTALRTSLGDAETDALFRQHDELIRAEIEAHRGQDQKAALGDGFLAVFVSTRRALACAIAIQRALDSFNLNRSGPPLRVRVGLEHRRGRVAGRTAVRRSGARGRARVRRRIGRTDPRLGRHPPARRNDPRRHVPRHRRAPAQRVPAPVAVMGGRLGPRDDASAAAGLRRTRERTRRAARQARDGARRTRRHGPRRRGAGRRQDDAREAADPRGRAARCARGVRTLLRVGRDSPVLAVRRDARAGARDHAAGDRARGHGRGRLRGRADGPRAAPQVPGHPGAARASAGAAAALLLQRRRLVHRARRRAVPVDAGDGRRALGGRTDAAADRAHGGDDARACAFSASGRIATSSSTCRVRSRRRSNGCSARARSSASR